MTPAAGWSDSDRAAGFDFDDCDGSGFSPNRYSAEVGAAARDVERAAAGLVARLEVPDPEAAESRAARRAARAAVAELPELAEVVAALAAAQFVCAWRSARAVAAAKRIAEAAREAEARPQAAAEEALAAARKRAPEAVAAGSRGPFGTFLNPAQERTERETLAAARRRKAKALAAREAARAAELAERKAVALAERTEAERAARNRPIPIVRRGRPDGRHGRL